MLIQCFILLFSHIGSSSDKFSSLSTTHSGESCTTEEPNDEKKTFDDSEHSSEPYIASVTMAITREKQEPMVYYEADCAPTIIKPNGGETYSQENDLTQPHSTIILSHVELGNTPDFREDVAMTPVTDDKVRTDHSKGTSSQDCDIGCTEKTESSAQSSKNHSSPTAAETTSSVVHKCTDPCSDTISSLDVPVDKTCDKCDIASGLVTHSPPSSSKSETAHEYSSYVSNNIVVDRTISSTFENSICPVDDPLVHSAVHGYETHHSVDVLIKSPQSCSGTDVSYTNDHISSRNPQQQDTVFQRHNDHDYETIQTTCETHSGFSVGSDHNYDTNVVRHNDKTEDEFENQDNSPPPVPSSSSQNEHLPSTVTQNELLQEPEEACISYDNQQTSHILDHASEDDSSSEPAVQASEDTLELSNVETDARGQPSPDSLQPTHPVQLEASGQVCSDPVGFSSSECEPAIKLDVPSPTSSEKEEVSFKVKQDLSCPDLHQVPDSTAEDNGASPESRMLCYPLTDTDERKQLSLSVSHDSVDTEAHNSLDTTLHNPEDTESLEPVDTVSHDANDKVSHDLMDTTSHEPVHTTSQDPGDSISHDPVSTMSLDPVNTVLHDRVIMEVEPISSSVTNPTMSPSDEMLDGPVEQDVDHETPKIKQSTDNNSLAETELSSTSEQNIGSVVEENIPTGAEEPAQPQGCDMPDSEEEQPAISPADGSNVYGTEVSCLYASQKSQEDTKHCSQMPVHSIGEDQLTTPNGHDAVDPEVQQLSQPTAQANSSDKELPIDSPSHSMNHCERHQKQESTSFSEMEQDASLTAEDHVVEHVTHPSVDPPNIDEADLSSSQVDASSDSDQAYKVEERPPVSDAAASLQSLINTLDTEQQSSPSTIIRPDIQNCEPTTSFVAEESSDSKPEDMSTCEMEQPADRVTESEVDDISHVDAENRLTEKIPITTEAENDNVYSEVQPSHQLIEEGTAESDRSSHLTPVTVSTVKYSLISDIKIHSSTEQAEISADENESVSTIQHVALAGEGNSTEPDVVKDSKQSSQLELDTKISHCEKGTSPQLFHESNNSAATGTTKAAPECDSVAEKELPSSEDDPDPVDNALLTKADDSAVLSAEKEMTSVLAETDDAAAVGHTLSTEQPEPAELELLSEEKPAEHSSDSAQISPPEIADADADSQSSVTPGTCCLSVSVHDENSTASEDVSITSNENITSSEIAQTTIDTIPGDPQISFSLHDQDIDSVSIINVHGVDNSGPLHASDLHSVVTVVDSEDQSTEIDVLGLDEPLANSICLPVEESDTDVSNLQPGIEPLTPQALTFSLPLMNEGDSVEGKSREFIVGVIQGNDGSLSLADMVETNEGDDASLVNASHLDPSSLLAAANDGNGGGNIVHSNQLISTIAGVDTNNFMTYSDNQLITLADSSSCTSGIIDSSGMQVIQVENTCLDSSQAGVITTVLSDGVNLVDSTCEDVTHSGSNSVQYNADKSGTVTDDQQNLPDSTKFYVDEAGNVIISNDVPTPDDNGNKVFIDENGIVHTIPDAGQVDEQGTALGISGTEDPTPNPSTTDDANVKFFIDDEGNIHTLSVDDKSSSLTSSNLILDESGVVCTAPTDIVTKNEAVAAVAETGIGYTSSACASGNEAPISVLFDKDGRTLECVSDKQNDIATTKFIIDDAGNLTTLSESHGEPPAGAQICSRNNSIPVVLTAEEDPNNISVSDKDEDTKYFMDEEGFIHSLPKDQVGDSTRLYMDESGTIHPLSDQGDSIASNNSQVFVDENGTIHTVSNKGLEDQAGGAKLYIDEDGVIHSIPDEDPAPAADQTKLIVDDEGKVYSLPPGMQEEIPEGSRVYIDDEGKVHTLQDDAEEKQADTKFFIDESGSVYTLPPGAEDDIVDGRVFIDETGKMHTLPTATDAADVSDEAALLQPLYQIIGENEVLMKTYQPTGDATVDSTTNLDVPEVHFLDGEPLPLFSNLTSSVELDLGNPAHMAVLSKTIPSPSSSPLKKLGLGRTSGDLGRFCHVCHATFPDLKTLVDHGKTHWKSDPKCPVCGKVLSKAYLKNHLLHHLKGDVYKCAMCRQKFASQEALLSHTSTHNETKFYQCDICLSSFRVLKYLETHVRKVHGSSRYICNVCEEVFNSSEERKQHKRLAHKNRVFPCKTCGEEFGSTEERKSHRKEVHLKKNSIGSVGLNKIVSAEDSAESVQSENVGESVRDVAHVMGTGLKCDICDIGFTDPAKLETHMNSHTGRKHYPCSQCSVSFISRWHLGRHFKSRHTVHQCSLCDEKFNGIKKLTKHMRVHTSVLVKCPVCQKQFTQQKFAKHMESHFGDKAYSCVCGQSFDDKPNLKQHMLTHRGTTSLSCGLCDHTASSEEDLVAHLDCHLEQKSYGCSVCSAEFTTAAKLTTHMRSHAALPYRCDDCNLSFKTTKKRDAHRKIHLRKKTHLCPICGSVFVQKPTFNKHMLEEHGVEYPVEELSSPRKKRKISNDRDNKNDVLESGMSISNSPDESEPFKWNVGIMEDISWETTCGSFDVEDTEDNPSLFSDTSYSGGGSLTHPTMMETTPTRKPKFVPVTPPRVADLDAETLMQYVLIDSGNAGMRCVFCERRFSKQSQIIRHLRTHAELKEKIAEAALQPWQKSPGHKSPSHVSPPTRIFCELCGKSFARSYNLYQHTDRVHNQSQWQDEFSETTRPQTFKRKLGRPPGSKSKSHSQSQGGFEKKLRRLPKKHGRPIGTYSWKKNNKHLLRNKAYMKTKQPHNDEIEQRKSQKRHLDDHCFSAIPVKRLKVDSENPFICPFCSESFTDHKDLDDHIVIYMSDKQFKFTNIGRSGRTMGRVEKTKITEYVRVSIDERVYACPMCSRGFLKKHELWNHMGDAHSEKIVSQAKHIKVKLHHIDTTGLKVKYWDGDGNVIDGYVDSYGMKFDQQTMSSGLVLDHDYLVDPLVAGNCQDEDINKVEDIAVDNADAAQSNPEGELDHQHTDDEFSQFSTDDEAFLCHLCYGSFSSEAELEEHSHVHRDTQKDPVGSRPEPEGKGAEHEENGTVLAQSTREEIQQPKQYEYSQVQRTLFEEGPDGNMNCAALTGQVERVSHKDDTFKISQEVSPIAASSDVISNRSPDKKSSDESGYVEIETQKILINGKITHIEIQHVHLPNEGRSDVNNASAESQEESETEQGDESEYMTEDDLEWDDDYATRMDPSADYDPEEDDPYWMEDDRESYSTEEGWQEEGEEDVEMEHPSGPTIYVCPDCDEPYVGDRQTHKRTQCTKMKIPSPLKVKETVTNVKGAGSSRQLDSMLSAGHGNESFSSDGSDKPPVYVDIVLDFIWWNPNEFYKRFFEWDSVRKI